MKEILISIIILLSTFSLNSCSKKKASESELKAAEASWNQFCSKEHFNDSRCVSVALESLLELEKPYLSANDYNELLNISRLHNGEEPNPELIMAITKFVKEHKSLMGKSFKGGIQLFENLAFADEEKKISILLEKDNSGINQMVKKTPNSTVSSYRIIIAGMTLTLLGGFENVLPLEKKLFKAYLSGQISD